MATAITKQWISFLELKHPSTPCTHFRKCTMSQSHQFYFYLCFGSSHGDAFRFQLLVFSFFLGGNRWLRVFPAKETLWCREEGRATVHDQVRLSKWGWIVAMCTSCYIVIVHVPWKSSSIWSGPWKIHITSKMYLQKHVISYINILMLYTIQICTWSGISKKTCRLRFWPWIKANLWSCRDFWRILRLQNSFWSPNHLCFEWQRYTAFHVVCKRCITIHIYIYIIYPNEWIT